MSHLKNFTLMVMLVLFISCKSNNDIQFSSDVKSSSVSSPFTIATLYDDKIVMPYPNIDLLNEEQGLTTTISFIDLDGTKRYMNSNLTNKCNSGVVRECSGYRDSFVLHTSLFKNKVVMIEDKFASNTFTNYTSLSIIDIDGSNAYEIDRSEEQATKNNLIALGDDKIYYSLTNNILVEYDYNTNSKKELSNDNDEIKDISSIFYENGLLYIHARLYGNGEILANYPILAFENDEFKLIASDVDGYVSHINEKFYIVDPSLTSKKQDAYIVYFDNKIVRHSQDFFGTIGVINDDDYLIINYMEEKDDQLFTIIKLYKIDDDKLDYLDELISEEVYYINAFSGNLILLTHGKQLNEGANAFAIFPAYTTIENDKLTSIKEINN